MEIDTARSPEPHNLSPISDPGSIPTLDGWIESLMSCKQLTENDVQRLCDRVSLLTTGPSAFVANQLFCLKGQRSSSRRVECSASGTYFRRTFTSEGHILINNS